MRDDLRSALRQVRRNPAFTSAVVLTLALGVGAVTAVLTIADPILFRPLPFPHPERLFVMSAGPTASLHVQDEVRAEAAGGSFESVGESQGPLDVTSIGTATVVSISYGLTPGFLPALGVQPILGRAFRDDEYRSRADVALIAYSLWQEAFGGRMDVLQRQVVFTGPRGHRYQVVGVLPHDFFFPDQTNEQPVVFVPRPLDPADARPNVVTHPLMRLKGDATLAAAAGQMRSILRGVERDYPAFERDRAIQFIPLRDALFEDVRTPLTMLLAATLCVLLLASANLAQLTRARLRARMRELGIRLAIGASRGRLVRQLLVEMTLLATAGGLAAFATGAILSRLAMAYLPPLAHAYRVVPPVLDLRIAALTAGMVLGTLAVFGIVPAIHASSRGLREVIDAAPRDNLARRIVGSDPVLIFIQATVAVALLVSGLLVVRSFVTLVETPVGFETSGVQRISALFAPEVFKNGRLKVANRRLYAALRERVGGDLAAAAGTPGLTLNTALLRPDESRRFASVDAWPVSGGFFSVMRIRRLRGRLFTDDEALSNAPVAVIDQHAADLLWPGADPLGRRVKEIDGTERTIVGLVRTVRTDLSGVRFQHGSGFVPFGRRESPWFFLYRSPARPLPVKELQSLANQIEPDTMVSTDQVDVFDRQLAQPRFLAIVLGTLTVVAVLLAFVGVFGIVTHEVGRRTKELGVRIALGASAGRIVRLVLKGSLLPALAGGVAGLSASLWFTDSLRALLIGVSPDDAAMYGLTLLLILMVVVLASLGPALRASRTDPMTALRAE